MATTHQQTIRVANESAFGSLTANAVDVSGLTFVAVEAERAAALTVGELPVNERATVRADPGALPPEVDTAYIGAAAMRSRRGSFDVGLTVRGIGGGSGGIGTHADSLLGRLLRTVMDVELPVTAGTTVTAVPSDGTITVADRRVAAIGSLIAIDHAGHRHYRIVTDIVAGDANAGTLTLHPEFAGGDALTTAATVRGCATYYQRSDMAHDASLAFRLDGRGVRTVVTGARLASLGWALEGKRAMLTASVQFAHAADDHSEASPVNPMRAAGTPAHMVGACSTATASLVNASAPVSGAAVGLPVAEFSASIAWTLAPVASPCSVLGVSNLEPVQVEATAQATLDAPVAAYADDMLQGVPRSYIFGFGPRAEGGGAVLCIPAGHLTADGSLRDVGGDIVRQALAVRAGGPAVESDASTALATSVLRIGLVL